MVFNKFRARAGWRAARYAVQHAGLICCIFLSAGSLWSQSSQDITIFIPAVSGTVGSIEDMAYFTEMLIMEVTTRNYTVTAAMDGAMYSLTGTTDFVAFPDEGTAPYSLQLSLTDNDTGATMLEQDIVYTSPEDVNNYLPMLIFHFLANIPLPPESAGMLLETDDWRHKWLYFSAGVFWSPRLYSGTFRSASLVNFGLALSIELHLLPMVSLESGAELASDWVAVSPENSIDYQGQVLEIPLLLKLVLKPGRHYMIEPYAGAQFNWSLNKFTIPPLVSVLTGVQYGVKAGPGLSL